MIGLLPLSPTLNNGRLAVAIGDAVYLFDVRWNERDAAWYLDLREEDETAILCNIKVLLGSKIGQTSTHRFFQENILTVVDTTGEGVDARFDDLGVRIQVVVADSTGSSL